MTGDETDMSDVLEAVNRGRALRGAQPLERLPSFYANPFDYDREEEAATPPPIREAAQPPEGA
jgi:hypothetical protein